MKQESNTSLLSSIFLFVVVTISLPIFAMKITSSVAPSIIPSPSISFKTALINVARSAELLRATESEKDETQKKLAQDQAQEKCEKVTQVPKSLVALGQKNASAIKKVFNTMWKGAPLEILSTFILDYIADEYVQYKELSMEQCDSYDCWVMFYPVVGLVLEDDGINLNIQLNGAKNSIDHQLVRWNLFSENRPADAQIQIKDYDYFKKSERKNLDELVSTRYMWWQIQAKNDFDSQGRFISPRALRVTLQYNLCHMIKAALQTT